MLCWPCSSVQFVLITSLTHFFLMCLFHFSTCFEHPSAHHQENKLYQYIIWYISLCVGGRLVCRSPDLYTRRPPTQSDIYQMMYWCNWLSWWWALCCSKHVEKWNKHTKKCVNLVNNTKCHSFVCRIWAVALWSNERVLTFIEYLQSNEACYGMCIVQITKTVIRKMTRWVLLQNMKSVLLKLREKSPLAKYWSVTADVMGGGKDCFEKFCVFLLSSVANCLDKNLKVTFRHPEDIP